MLAISTSSLLAAPQKPVYWLIKRINVDVVTVLVVFVVVFLLLVLLALAFDGYDAVALSLA